MTEPVVVTFVRHGEPEGRRDIFRGRTDDPLTPRGWSQLHAVLAEQTAFAAIVTSPRARCAAFARAWAERREQTALQSDDLAEMDFGDWDGLTHDEVRARFGPAVDAFRIDPAAVTPPNGESLLDFIGRVARAVASLQTMRGPILAVTHAGVIRAALAHCLGLAPDQWNRIALGYAASARISYLDGEKPVLLELRSNLCSAFP